MIRRTAAAALTTALLLPTLAACGDHDQGHAERAPKTKATTKEDAKGPDCGADSNLSQAEWTEQCADKPDNAGNHPNTELKVGDTFAYNDGLKVTVASIRPVTRFSEFDSKPESDQTAFRVNIKFDNQSKKAINLDDFSVNGQGATKGGDAEFTSWEIGAKEISGRLAAGATDTKTSDGVLDKQYGTTLLVTATRLDDTADLLAEDPHWTGDIK